MKSKCCSAPVIIEGETTKYYACLNCGKPTDIIPYSLGKSYALVIVDEAKEKMIEKIRNYAKTFYHKKVTSMFISKKSLKNTPRFELFELVILLPELWFTTVGPQILPSDYPLLQIKAENRYYTYTGKQNIKSSMGSGTYHTFTRTTS